MNIICCRTCFATKLESYICLDGDLIDIIEECISIKVQTDDIFERTALYVCFTCKKFLMDLQQFKRKCLEVDLLWKNYIETLRVKVDPSPNDLKEEIKKGHCIDASTFVDCDETKPLNKHIGKLGKGFKCKECQREYRYIKSLVKHYTHAHTDVKASEVCLQCDLTFRFKEELNLHQIEAHVNGVLTHESKKSRKPYKCQHCPRAYNNDKLKKDHEKTHGANRFFCNVCKKGFPVNGLLTRHYKKVHAEVEPMKCNECQFIAYEATRLERHQVYEHRDSCPKCSLKRTQTKQFVDHVRRCLKGAYNVPQTCKFCGRHYNHLRSLMKHVNLRHNTTDKRRICEICGAKVLHIKLHERIHMKDPQAKRTQKCGYCGDEFDTRALLFKHHKTMHPDRFANAERKFACDVCHKKFTSRQYLMKHKRIVHDATFKVTCSVCARPFKTNSDLKRHMQSHTNDRRYQCHLCERRYFDNAKLQAHVRTHTGERPFVCVVCGKAFSRNDTLRAHMRSSHD